VKISVTDVDGRSARDVMHPNLSTIPPDATLDEVEAYFAASTSRRLGTVVDDGRYVGAIDAEAFAAGAHPPGGVARDLVRPHPTVGPDTEAAEARDLALATVARRVPVVDDAGMLLGVVAIDKTLTGFCS
jgi:CBS domain-containing protein